MFNFIVDLLKLFKWQTNMMGAIVYNYITKLDICQMVFKLNGIFNKLLVMTWDFWYSV